MPTNWTIYTPAPNRLTDDDLQDALRLAGVHALLSLSTRERRKLLLRVLPDEADVADALALLDSQGERMTQW